MTIVEEVKNKYVYFLKETPNRNKFYHLKSIENFMLSFDEFGSMHTKYEAANILNEYFDYVIANEISNEKDCKYLFFTFIEPIGNIYKRDLGFSFLFTTPTIIIYFIPTIFLMIYLKFPFYLTLSIATVGIFLFIKVLKKRESKKVFGYSW